VFLSPSSLEASAIESDAVSLSAMDALAEDGDPTV
jgi:hypothetical protein